ncbi:MAG: hypothetical protein GY935_03515 [Gammaproteobacteria bacterium]|nr:hypothetical protein [Gammaproteobacteria bacterium]
MTRYVYFFLALMFAVLTASCATSYYGHTAEAWNKLSEAEKVALRAEYQHMIDTKTTLASQDKTDARTQSFTEYGNKKAY